jgi:hypothetical protein
MTLDTIRIGIFRSGKIIKPMRSAGPQCNGVKGTQEHPPKDKWRGI